MPSPPLVGPLHYCPDCRAESLLAPTPGNDPSYPGLTYQIYACGAVVYYRPDWSIPFRWPCRTFVVGNKKLQHTQKKLVDNIKAGGVGF
jgi:hypothetical protein